MYECRIEKDSVSPAGHRLTTMVITAPRIILAELNTHRVRSASTASSRAIPGEKMLTYVMEDPFLPVSWGKRQAGMVADEEFMERGPLDSDWLAAASDAMKWAKRLLEKGVHKQITNRLLEPWLWSTIIWTATEWTNFLNLRTHRTAMPEMQKIAWMMKTAYESSTPVSLSYEDWHMPLVDTQELLNEVAEYESETDFHPGELENIKRAWAKVSAGRCAAVSYMRQETKDVAADIARAERLLIDGHMVPWEHPCRPMTEEELEFFKQPVVEWDEPNQAWLYVPGKDGKTQYTHFLGNVNGWVQRRKTVPCEAVWTPR